MERVLLDQYVAFVMIYIGRVIVGLAYSRRNYAGTSAVPRRWNRERYGQLTSSTIARCPLQKVLTRLRHPQLNKIMTSLLPVLSMRSERGEDLPPRRRRACGFDDG